MHNIQPQKTIFSLQIMILRIYKNHMLKCFDISYNDQLDINGGLQILNFSNVDISTELTQATLFISE